MTLDEFSARYSFDRARDCLGTGSFGMVYKAYDTALDGWVALKISPVRSQRWRLRREVELISGLPMHANVARYEACYTFTDASGEFDVAVLRYYPEGSIADLLSAKALDCAQLVDLLTQILDGLQFLHDNNIAHRDLKPANILIARRPDGRIVPKITDFGISKPVGDEDETAVLDATISTAATVNYASPEQLSGMAAGKRSDIWSFGVIAYRMVTGRMPFDSGLHASSSLAGRAEVVRQITSGVLPPGVETLPPGWQAIIKSCLVTDPVRRTVTEDDLKWMLATVNSHLPEITPPTPSNGRIAGSQKPKNYVPKPDIGVRNVKQGGNTATKVLIIVLMLALSVLAIYVFNSHRNSSRPVTRRNYTPVRKIESRRRPEVVKVIPADIVDTVSGAYDIDTAIFVHDADTMAPLLPPSSNEIDSGESIVVAPSIGEEAMTHDTIP